MSDYTLDTTTRQEGAIIIDGHRYLRAGLTRTVQKTVNHERRILRNLEPQMAQAVEADDGERFDALEDEAVAHGLAMICALLEAENGAQPAHEYLQEKWMAGELRADVHLWPLIEHLTEGMQQPVPPASAPNASTRSGR